MESQKSWTWLSMLNMWTHSCCIWLQNLSAPQKRRDKPTLLPSWANAQMGISFSNLHKNKSDTPYYFLFLCLCSCLLSSIDPLPLFFTQWIPFHLFHWSFPNINSELPPFFIFLIFSVIIYLLTFPFKSLFTWFYISCHFIFLSNI